MRTLAAVALFAAACLLGATAAPAGQEVKQPEKKKAKVDPKTFIPDAATLKQIQEKTERLRKAVAALQEKKIPDVVLIEVEIYLKAAENIVRFEEWLHRDSVKWAQQTIDQGLERAKQAEGGKPVWDNSPGKWVVRAYRSQIDNSIQPYAVLLPHDYGKDPKKRWRLDIVLHGRDGSLSEAKFIATHQGNAPKDLGYVQLEVYGRGNNAYRWAGEKDVFEAMDACRYADIRGLERPTFIDSHRIVLRGFSMGGAGTWHIGLQTPDYFCVMGPGAGFTTTHGYIANLPKQLPDYQEKCLHIYDAVDYAENAFNIPIVAYSGENDPQKKAADNIETILKEFKEPHKFTHLVAPGLEHQMPKEWQEKAEAEYRKYADKPRDRDRNRVRFVTYTPRYYECDWLVIFALDESYRKAVVDATRAGRTVTVKTSNARWIFVEKEPMAKGPVRVVIDDQVVETSRKDDPRGMWLEKRDGVWEENHRQNVVNRFREKPEKWAFMSGPIDDAFRNRFVVVGPSSEGWEAASMKQFAHVWDKYFRGTLPTVRPEEYKPEKSYIPEKFGHLILFGTPDTNPLIAKVVPLLPITWTKEKLVVNGVEYDPKTHVPVLIYPNPLDENKTYVVLNSGHTFKEADLKGTNALLYPRLGDWAVIKPTPTEKDPAAYEVVAAGLFDENWQFPKKK
jgi:predicted esterase